MDAAPLLRLALRMLAREWRAGELYLLGAALVVAVGSITAVGLFTDRLDRAMQLQAAELLAADLVVSSPDPVSAAHAERAQRMGLAQATTLTFRTMAVHGETLQLAEVKAVGTGYPLRGRLRVTEAPFGVEESTQALPEPGTVWVDQRLLAALGAGVGDSLELGEKRFRIGRILSYEPDRAGDLFSIAPRVMLPLDDVAETGLLQPGSRVQWRLLAAGSADRIRGLRAALGGTLAPGEQLQGLQDARPEMRDALERARQFLGLASLAAVLLAGVAIALSARRHARRHVDASGLLRCLGLARAQVVRLFTYQLAMLGLAGAGIGAGIGYLAQQVLVWILAPLFLQALPAPSPIAAGIGAGFGLLVLLGFGLPPLLALGRVPPARVLRRETPAPSLGGLSVGAAAILGSTGLVLWQAADWRLALYVIGGAAGLVVCLALSARLLVATLQTLRGRVGVSWRFGLANIARRGGSSTVQAVSFGLGLMALLLLAIVRNDLLDAWADKLPPGTPNYFLLNVQPGQSAEVRAFLEARGVAEAATYPMVRGRLTRLNARSIGPDDYPEPRAQRLVEREFNLSFSDALAAENRITAGAWWTDAGGDSASPEQFSVEQGLAETLGIRVGDRLEFQVAGEPVVGTVTSLREVSWETFDVNFFVVSPPALLAGYPATYISSFHLPPAQRALLAELVKRYPSITVIDIDALLSKVRGLMDHASRGVEFVFLFTLLAGICVLAAAVHGTLDERRVESALFRTLGASRARVRRAIAAEFLTLGALAGILAAGGATAVGALLASQVLGLPFTPSPWVWIIGVPAGAAGICLTGIVGTRRVVDHPPLAALRSSGG